MLPRKNKSLKVNSLMNLSKILIKISGGISEEFLCPSLAELLLKVHEISESIHLYCLREFFQISEEIPYNISKESTCGIS